VLNAAHELAVAAFLEGQVGLGAVPEIVARVLDAHAVMPVTSVEQLEEVDRWARERARLQAVHT